MHCPRRAPPLICALAAGLALAACQPARRGSPPPALPPPILSRADLSAALEAIRARAGAPGLVAAVVEGDRVTVLGFGQVGPGDPRAPDGATVVRLDSVSKLLTSQVLASLAADGKVRLGDPLARYAPAGWRSAARPDARPIELIDLATHTSGLPRNADIGITDPTAVIDPAVATAARWAWLGRLGRRPSPGVQAAYSNAGFDLLADALAKAGGAPYPAELRRLVTAPLGMADTTPSPTADECRRMMTPDPRDGPRPCADTAASAGAGGVYSTAADMGRWLRRELAPDQGGPIVRATQAVVYRRESLLGLQGVDGAGPAAGVGMAWIELAADTDHPRLLEKTGGGGGFLTYVALAPAQRAGVFVAIDDMSRTGFLSITRGVNVLIGALIGQAPPSAVAAALTQTAAETPPRPPSVHLKSHRPHKGRGRAHLRRGRR